MVHRSDIGMMTLPTLALVALEPPQSAALDSDAVHWVPGWCTPPRGLCEVTAGDHLSAGPMASVDRSPGQIARAAGSGVADVTQLDAEPIVQVTSAAAASNFATGITWPTGPLPPLTRSGTQRAVSWSSDAVYHATGFGDFSIATPHVDACDFAGLGGRIDVVSAAAAGASESTRDCSNSARSQLYFRLFDSRPARRSDSFAAGRQADHRSFHTGIARRK
jgi:hypothetical protein